MPLRYLSRNPLSASIMTLFLLAALCACQQKNSGPPSPPPPEVAVVKVTSAPVTLFEDYAAQTEAVESVEIRARVNGILERQGFKDGAPVRKGDLLFIIDQQPFIAALAQAKANLSQAEASHLNSRQNLGRFKSLIAVNAISQQDLDGAIAKERADAASIEAAKAQLRQAQLNLGYATIRAPRDGVISKSLIRPGGLVNASATLLTTLYSVDPMYVGFTISERKFGELKAQGNARDPKSGPPEFGIKLIDGSTYAYKGRLDFVDATVDPKSGTLPVRLVVPNPHGELKPGQFIRVILTARQDPDAIVIPQKAVQELQGRHSVFIVGPDNKAEYRDVKAAARIGNDWLVEQGLKPGELLIVEGIAKVKPGALVKPVPSGAEPGHQGQQGPPHSGAGGAPLNGK